MRHTAASIVLATSIALIPAATATAKPAGNYVIGYGTVTEVEVGWTITFDIHAKNNGQSTQVSVTTETDATTVFTGTTCSGTYSDPVDGTYVYAVGPIISGPQIFEGETYAAYIVHVGGPYGADRSRVVPGHGSSLASARAFCDSISSERLAFRLGAPSNAVFPHL